MIPERLPHDFSLGQVTKGLFHEYLELSLGSHYGRAETVFDAYWQLNVFSDEDYTFKVANVLYMASQVSTDLVVRALEGLEKWAEIFPKPNGWDNLNFDQKIVRCVDTRQFFDILYGELFDVQGAFSSAQPGEQERLSGLIIPRGVRT